MGEIKIGGTSREEVARKVRQEAVTALKNSDFTDILGSLGVEKDDGATSAALKAVLAERITEYAVGAVREAKRRGVRLGAADDNNSSIREGLSANAPHWRFLWKLFYPVPVLNCFKFSFSYPTGRL